MTLGKLVFGIIIVIISVIDIAYYVYVENPFSRNPENLLQILVGISSVMLFIGLFIFLIYYIVDNWDKKL